MSHPSPTKLSRRTLLPLLAGGLAAPVVLARPAHAADDHRAPPRRPPPGKPRAPSAAPTPVGGGGVVLPHLPALRAISPQTTFPRDSQETDRHRQAALGVPRLPARPGGADGRPGRARPAARALRRRSSWRCSPSQDRWAFASGVELHRGAVADGRARRHGPPDLRRRDRATPTCATGSWPSRAWPRRNGRSTRLRASSFNGRRVAPER